MSSNEKNKPSDDATAKRSLDQAKADLLRRASKCSNSSLTPIARTILEDLQTAVNKYGTSRGFSKEHIPAIFPDVIGFSTNKAREDTYNGYWEQPKHLFGSEAKWKDEKACFFGVDELKQWKPGQDGQSGLRIVLTYNDTDNVTASPEKNNRHAVAVFWDPNKKNKQFFVWSPGIEDQFAARDKKYFDTHMSGLTQVRHMSRDIISKSYEFFATGDANKNGDQCVPKALNAIILAAIGYVCPESDMPWHADLLYTAAAQTPNDKKTPRWQAIKRVH